MADRGASRPRANGGAAVVDVVEADDPDDPDEGAVPLGRLVGGDVDTCTDRELRVSA